MFPEVWTTETELSSGQRKEQAAGEGSDYVLFGKLTGGTPSMIANTYDTSLQTWTDGTNSPAAQCLGGICHEDPGTGIIYVYGGHEVTSAFTPLGASIKTVYSYTVATDTWATLATDAAATGVREMGSARDSRVMYMVGGYVNTPSSPRNDHTSYDMSSNTFGAETVSPFSRSYQGGFGGCGDSLLHYGGGTVTGLSGAYPPTITDAQSYNPSGNTWDASLPDLPVAHDRINNTSCSVTPP